MENICVYVIVVLLVFNYWKLALEYGSQQIKTKHHLRMFIFIFLTTGSRRLSLMLPMNTDAAALSVNLMWYQWELSSIYSFRGGAIDVGLAQNWL